MERNSQSPLNYTRGYGHDWLERAVLEWNDRDTMDQIELTRALQLDLDGTIADTLPLII